MKTMTRTVVFLLILLSLSACNPSNSNVVSSSDTSHPPLTGCLRPDSYTENAHAYIQVFDSYFGVDAALEEDMAYLAIDMDSLPGITETDKEYITSYYENKLCVPVKDASYEDLAAENLVLEQHYIEGLLLYLEDVVVEEDIMTVTGTKYKGGLAANGFESTLQKTEDGWALQSTNMMWIS